MRLVNAGKDFCLDYITKRIFPFAIFRYGIYDAASAFKDGSNVIYKSYRVGDNSPSAFVCFHGLSLPKILYQFIINLAFILAEHLNKVVTGKQVAIFIVLSENIEFAKLVHKGCKLINSL